jgi:uncharacterized protein YjbJ (UPF0337 family)
MGLKGKVQVVKGKVKAIADGVTNTAGSEAEGNAQKSGRIQAEAGQVKNSVREIVCCH